MTERYEKDFSASNLWNFRQFYLSYVNRHPEILDTSCREFEQRKKLYPAGGESFLPKKGRPAGDESPEPKSHPAGGESLRGFLTDLSWSHYRALMRVENESTRFF